MVSLDNRSNKNSNMLDVKVKNYRECGYCLEAKNKVVLNIPWAIWSQWVYLSQHIGSKEWGAVFWVKDNTITHFKIPKQEVNSTECEFKEELGGDGMVHSHHNMDAFHSLQDDRHARNLYEYSIVLSNAKGYEATKRMKLPCGGFGYVKVEMYLIGCPDMDLSKITEKKQELMLETNAEDERRQQLNFDTDESPCYECVSHDCDRCEFFDMNNIPCVHCDNFRCKTCKFTIGKDIAEMLPFCDFCEHDEFCNSCLKLDRYLRNYPEDKKQFEYLLTDNL
ncbi:MAG TPA: hypothetical protein VMX17_14650 [Candidatus Glassbacteria bacterium]|nr:hypothetical protein [Candidatus Glassbacteria bacterium]